MPAEFKVSDAVRDVLRRSPNMVMGGRGEWTLNLPEQQLDRKLYLDVDKVLKAAGGKWNKSRFLLGEP